MDLNHYVLPYQGSALPIELRKQIECETEVMNLIKSRSSDAYTQAFFTVRVIRRINLILIFH